ncbi:hypothetical protein HPB47_014319, partial [Ixodes persulcatus]
LAQNNALLRKSLPHVPEAVRGPAPKSFSSAVQLPNVRLRDAEPPSTQQQYLASVSGSRPEEGPSQPDRRQTVDEDGYTIVRRKQKTKVAEGTRAESRLGVVPRPPRKRALFVSRLSPSTTASNVCEVLEDVLQGKSVHCTKLLSKYDSYASFHVCVDTDCFDLINDPNDFKKGLEKAGVLGEIAVCGSYQTNQVWMVILKTLLANQKLVSPATFEVKGKRCVVIDPEKSEERLKLHWLPFHLHDDVVKKNLEQYGKVEDVGREFCRIESFEGVQSTTRVVRLTLREGVTHEKLPHQLRLPGCTALVLAPGRAPLCLRCRRTGHNRRECRVPRCDSCRRFGHLRDDCRKTYADVTNSGTADDNSELIMDQDEAQEAAGGRMEGGQPQGRAETPADAPPAEVSATVELPAGDTDVPELVHNDVARGPALKGDGCEHDYARRKPTLGTSQGQDDPEDGQMDAMSGSAKRPLEPTTTQEPGQPGNVQESALHRWQTGAFKKGRRHAAPQGPPEDHASKFPL